MDATFLQSVFEVREKGVTILDMIAIIDYVDRSTPTFEMFISALERLSIAELIFEKDGKYYPTKNTDEIRKTIYQTNRRRKQVWLISDFLETWEKEGTFKGEGCKMFTREEYDKALKDYHENF